MKSWIGKWFAALAILAVLLPGLAQAAAEVTGLQLVSSTRVGRTSFDYTYRVQVRNGSPALGAAQATARSTAAATQVVQGTVALGNLAAGASVSSTETITLRQDRSTSFNPASLVWSVTGQPQGEQTLSLSLSDAVLAPGGILELKPVVRDGNGVVQSNAGLQFNATLAPIGPVTGNAPVVSGLSVSFPKLSKRLLAANPAIDPAGEFADTDPTDPNYGRETGGRYRVTVALAGSSLSASEDVTVLPMGTAQVTVKASQYAGQLGSALALAHQASLSGDTALMDQARAALRAVDAQRDFRYAVLSATNAAAPPDGGLLLPALLTARGYVAGAQDAAYAAAIADVTSKLRQARAQLDATNVAALTQASVDALQAAAVAYKQSLQTLKTLQVSALGGVQQQAAMNALLATELPKLLDSIKRKTGELLGVTVTASVDTPRLLELGTVTEVASQSPAAMYAQTQPVQYYAFFSTAFAIFTDLSGTARGNIIELSITLANIVLNVTTANIINQNANGAVAMDYCLASSSFAWVCPNYRPTRIGGSGFGTDAGAIKVALVGCVNSNAIRNLMTLSRPTNIAAGIRLFNKVVSLANSLQQDGGVAAVVVPDYIASDEIGLANDMLYFGNGWPRVNQGRLPCVGIVIVMNFQTGGITALNLNFLGQCG
jgi:hypothetical protein